MDRILPLVALIACAPETQELAPSGRAPSGTDAEDYVPAGEVAPMVAGLALTAGAVHPGGVVEVTVTNARPGELVYVASSRGGLGNGPCPAWAGGLCLDLGSATRLPAALGAADPNGSVTFEVPAADTLVTGSRLTFQALVKRGPGGASSQKSNASVKVVGDPAWRGAVTLDGDLSDWTAEEWFSTTSQVGRGGVTWDADTLYVAFDHPDVATGGDLHWEVVFVATGAPGSTTGPTIGTQTPSLPFEADLVVRRKADGSYDDALVWDAVTSQWVSTPGALSQPGWGAAEAGQGLELAIPRSALGHQLEVALAQVYEGAGFESTYAGVPSGAFADGYDPDLADALVLDLSSPSSPLAQNP